MDVAPMNITNPLGVRLWCGHSVISRVGVERAPE